MVKEAPQYLLQLKVHAQRPLSICRVCTVVATATCKRDCNTTCEESTIHRQDKSDLGERLCVVAQQLLIFIKAVSV